jgi:putative ATP-binding cassette transporter
MRLLQFLLGISRKTVILAVLFGVLGGVSSTALLALVSQALTEENPSSAALVWGFLGLCLLMPVTRFASDFLLTRLGQEGVFKLRMKLCRQILSAPLRQLEELGAHRLLATLNDDIVAITSALFIIPTLCINTAIALGCMIYLGWLSGYVLLVLLGFLVLGVLSYQLPITRGMRLFKLARECGDELYKSFRALTEGIKELKLNQRRREAFLDDVLETTASSMRRHNVAASTFFIAATSWGNVLFFIFIGTILFLVPRVAVIDSAARVASTLTILYLITPLDIIMNTLSSLSRANVALNKIETLGLTLSAQENNRGRALPRAVQTPPPRLEMRGVTHAYHRERENSSFILGPLDLTFAPGELVFLTGGNGSGKTTLIKLITGLYLPEAGEIRLDGKAVTSEMRDDYREQFATVFSDFFLFESLLGLDSAGVDDRALEYLKQLHLDHMVRVHDGALSTTALSQGQRRRLALLVAYLEDRPFYVFDEWAADQDPYFKDIFYYQILPELKARGKTTIVISHDDRYYPVADRIIKLENGSISDGATVYQEPILFAHDAPTKAPV